MEGNTYPARKIKHQFFVKCIDLHVIEMRNSLNLLVYYKNFPPIKFISCKILDKP